MRETLKLCSNRSTQRGDKNLRICSDRLKLSHLLNHSIYKTTAFSSAESGCFLNINSPSECPICNRFLPLPLLRVMSYMRCGTSMPRRNIPFCMMLATADESVNLKLRIVGSVSPSME